MLHRDFSWLTLEYHVDWGFEVLCTREHQSVDASDRNFSCTSCSWTALILAFCICQMSSYFGRFWFLACIPYQCGCSQPDPPRNWQILRTKVLELHEFLTHLSFDTRHRFHTYWTHWNLIISLVGSKAAMIVVRIMFRTVKTKPKMTLIKSV